MKSTKFRAMGTDVEILIGDADEEKANVHHAVARATDVIHQLESVLTRFRPESALSQLNQLHGRWQEVDPNLYTVLRLAQEAFDATKGMFNPCLGMVMESIGYDVSFDLIGEQNLRPVFEIPFVAPMHCPFTLAEDGYGVYLEPGYKVDLGGIGKGWIVQQAASILVSMGIEHFVCNAGGDLICRGKCGDEPWAVGIADPFNTQQPVLTLDIENLSVATSGSYRRKWNRGGRTVHHLIDPYLGTPVETDIVSCTVVHEDLVQGEVMAKVAILLGKEAASSWLNRQGCNAWMMITEDREVVKSCNF